MEVLSYSHIRQDLAKTLDKVCKDHSPIIVTRQGKKHNPVVIMSLEDYENLEETAYLLRAPKNTRRLIESIAQLEDGKGKIRSLAE